MDLWWILSIWPLFFFFKQKTAYEMRISDWSSDVCSSDLDRRHHLAARQRGDGVGRQLEGVRRHGKAPDGSADSLRHQPSTPRDQTLARRMRLKKTPARGRRSSGLHGAEISPPCPTGQAPPCRCRGHGRTRCPARRRSASPGPATTASAPRSEEHPSQLQSLLSLSYAV